MPWHVGRVFIGQDGWAYQVFADRSGVGAATGYVLKKFNPSNPEEAYYSAGPNPDDAAAKDQAWRDSPAGQDWLEQQKGLGEQTRWNNNQAEGKLDLDRETLAQGWNIHKDDNMLARDRLKQEYEIAMRSARTEEEKSRIDAWYKYNLVQNARIELGTKLRGPENHFYYQEAAARGRANPITNGVASWFNPGSNQATGTGAWGGGEPSRGDLGSMGAQFGAGDTNWFGNVNSTGNATTDGVSGNVQNDQSTLAAFNEFFKNPHKAAPGFLESRNPDQLKLMQGAADYLGHSWDTSVNRYNITRPRQSIAGSLKA